MMESILVKLLIIMTHSLSQRPIYLFNVWYSHCYVATINNIILVYFLDCPFVSIANKSPYMVKVGSLAILLCSATSKPSPLVQWCKEEITCHPPHLDQSFYVVPTNVPHTTIYTCKAVNYIADVKCSRSANITVIVQ